MPQGLLKKIEVGLLLADLALELRDPTPRRRSLIEDRTAQRRAVQPALARPARPAQRLQPALPNLLLPFVQTTTVDPKIRRHRRHRLAGRHPELNFIPVLSHVNGEAWDGERGFVHQSVDAKLKQLAVDGQGDVYACGPPPMIDALQPVLFMNGFETERIFFDRFTTSSNAAPAH